jgi:hypothetical protein
MDSLDLWNSPTFTNSSDLSFDDSFDIPSPSFTPYSIEPSDFEDDSIANNDNDDDSIVYLYTIYNSSIPPYREIIFPRHAFFIQCAVSNRKLMIKIDPMVIFMVILQIMYYQ